MSIVQAPTKHWKLKNNLLDSAPSPVSLTMIGSLSWTRGPFGYANTALTGFEDDSSGFAGTTYLYSEMYGVDWNSTKAIWVNTACTAYYQPLVSFSWGNGYWPEIATSMFFIGSTTSEPSNTQKCLRFQITYISSFESIYLSDDIISDLAYPDDGLWHLCGMSIDGDGNIKFFIDHSVSSTYTLSAGYPQLSGNAAAIGADQTGQTDSYFSGSMGAIRDFAGDASMVLSQTNFSHLYDYDKNNHGLYHGSNF